MAQQTNRINRPVELTQKDVLDGFARCQSELFERIREITDENKGENLMIALKTKRIIEKWFRQAGRL